ncbi:RNA polymerase sigma factor [Engelhardtia mirabilis]|uniref:RNA polymerase sigma factor n=1 Tax=Engelhardtia mirabilis TaxID=2528011 RepID=A0A518BHF1_9BACT|nr:RNA polymerase sigma factor [Planctomycetes bacterium Pla133]QDV00738.1 RNA polymerase sigma factor [Planctomycetes bacterium Pla86]
MQLDSNFHTTHWDLVRQAGDSGSDDGRAALGTLIEIYWYPLYAYLRRRGKSMDDAADAVQGLFATLLSRSGISRLDQANGRFRSWLLTSLENYLRDEYRRATSIKRGGGFVPQSLDLDSAEARYRLEPEDGLDAEALYRKEWALEVINRARDALQTEYIRAGKRRLFDALSSELETGDRAAGVDPAEFEMTPVAMRVARHRLRERFANQLRTQARATLGSGLDEDEELRELIQALEGPKGR